MITLLLVRSGAWQCAQGIRSHCGGGIDSGPGVSYVLPLPLDLGCAFAQQRIGDGRLYRPGLVTLCHMRIPPATSIPWTEGEGPSRSPKNIDSQGAGEHSSKLEGGRCSAAVFAASFSGASTSGSRFCCCCVCCFPGVCMGDGIDGRRGCSFLLLPLWCWRWCLGGSGGSCSNPEH